MIVFLFNLSDNTPAMGAIKIWGKMYKNDPNERKIGFFSTSAIHQPITNDTIEDPNRENSCPRRK
jgi:hypothetical protein